ncbi:unnamed protein product [Owenia fusiformis]|uniref:Inositol 1,4,5-trisphosphate receptor n=1 Tax=Owenia fusiformis TaxID=6347 RepID=A0A8J1T9Y8_OWEFU|nr:unnamed protein product [Owenia fusiformis]
MSDFLCFGDYICLYCEETEGYAYSLQSSSAHNSLYVYNGQSKELPLGLANVQAIVFQVVIQNRYKLDKKYRKWKQAAEKNPGNTETKAMLGQAKNAVKAEHDDNRTEQKRQMGKMVRYGEIIQLQHVFTQKFIHANPNQASRRDKNNIMVQLHSYNAKAAQFRVLPKYKVKAEGEFVQILDQVIFESAKTPGQYFHASAPYKIDHFSTGSELNLGVDMAGFTVVKHYRPSEETDNVIRSGSVLRLFHKDLEAYVVAEGVFGEPFTEDVHLRLREVDQLKGKTLYPSTSGNTYWQIEKEDQKLHGEMITWEQQVRFRHMATRMYLMVTPLENRLTLTNDELNPNAVFRLHPVINDKDEVVFNTFARIEHVLSKKWLHGLKDQEYKRKKCENVTDPKLLAELQWDGGELRQVSTNDESVYSDVYTFQDVGQKDQVNFNFVAGMVPCIRNFIKDRKKKKRLSGARTIEMCTAFNEMRQFILPDGQPNKNRQKLFRNLRLIDMIVEMLQCPMKEIPDKGPLTQVFKSAYTVINAYLEGGSRKNSLYVAQFIDFFQSQMTLRGEIGLNVTQMLAELIRDSEKIVKRVNFSQIEKILALLKNNSNYRYLDLLSSLCVCNQRPIRHNQNFIAERWLKRDKSLFLTSRGQSIKRQMNVIYVSWDNGKSWTPAREVIDETSADYNRDRHMFFKYQVELCRQLCYGRNMEVIRLITYEMNYLGWEEAFIALESTQLPDEVRAEYCRIIIDMFVDVGDNYPVVEYANVAFAFDDIGMEETKPRVSQTVAQFGGSIATSGDLMTVFPVVHDWISNFLEENQEMIASETGRNKLIAQVLRLLYNLIKFGYYGDVEEIHKLQKPLLHLLDGRHDKPFPKDKATGSGYSKEAKKAVKLYQDKDRYEADKDNRVIMEAKFQAMEVLDMIFKYQNKTRLDAFIVYFKETELSLAVKKKKHPLSPLLFEQFDPLDTSSKMKRQQKRAFGVIKDVFDKSAYFNEAQLTNILLDLANYKQDKMVTKALMMLTKFYSSKTDMFTKLTTTQVFTTLDSCSVHREVQNQNPLLRNLSRIRLNDKQAFKVEEIFFRYLECCSFRDDPNIGHPVNQNIMLCHGVLDLLFTMLTMDYDTISKPQRSMKMMGLKLLRGLVKGNDEIQNKVFKKLGQLLEIPHVESQLAVTLKQVFVANQQICIKVVPQQIKSIIQLVCQHRQNAPEFLYLLAAIVKVEGLDLCLKRNQSIVMKYLMMNYSKIFYMFEKPYEEREKILMNKSGPVKLRYLIGLVDLLSTCAEGESRYIESLCQSILPLDEILLVLNNPDVQCHLKRSFLQYMLNVYMNSGSSIIESGAAELSHQDSLWSYLTELCSQIDSMSEAVKSTDREELKSMLKLHPSHRMKDTENITNAALHDKLWFMLDGAMPFLRTFYSNFFSADVDNYEAEIEVTERIALLLLKLCEGIRTCVTNPSHLKTIMMCVTTVATVSSIPTTETEAFARSFATLDWVNAEEAGFGSSQVQYYKDEIALNNRLRMFSMNASLLYGGHNTVKAQLKINGNKREYTELGGDQQLPLGEEFQNLVKSFLSQDPKHHKHVKKKYAPAAKLIQQLEISSKYLSEMNEAEALLNTRCLQILSAMIHNEERKLPEDYETDIQRHQIQLDYIREVQSVLNDMKGTVNCLPQLGSTNVELVRETLSFLALSLFNANRTVQETLIHFFENTREESFFAAVRTRIHRSGEAIKESRALLAQQRSRKKESNFQAINMRQGHGSARRAFQNIQQYEQALKKNVFKMMTEEDLLQMTRKRAKLDEKPKKPEIEKPLKEKDKGEKSKKKTKKGLSNGGIDKNDKSALVPSEENGLSFDEALVMGMERQEDDRGIDNKGFVPTLLMAGTSKNKKAISETHKIMDGENEEEEQDDNEDEIAFKDDGYIKLVLQVLAAMCDGQFTPLQDYLRVQEDNLRSYNILAEITQFLSMVYTNIKPSSAKLAIRLFNTINETSTGNQANRVVILNNKVVDYINFILRARDIACDPDQVLELRSIISQVLISLIEENSPEAYQVAKEIKDTLDKEAVYRCMTECFELHQKKKFGKKKSTMEAMIEAGGNLMKGIMEGNDKDEMRELLTETGFNFYLVLQRMYDIDPLMDSKEGITLAPMQMKAFKYYKKNTMSVEVLKDDYLQKKTFRVKNKNLLREEIKEKMKWSIDRTSPSNKIRDFMQWTNDIVKDIYYQKKILSNPIAAFLSKNWSLWNYICILLSVAINILMLVVWKAKRPLTIDDLPDGPLPAAMYDPEPDINDNIMSKSLYNLLIWIMGGTHNFFSLVLIISYLLSNHPQLPDCSWISNFCRACCSRKDEDEDDYTDEKVVKKVPESKLATALFSFATIYYMVFLASSLAGTFFWGYFFAFHLLNIVNNNQLLQGVINAVTQNGRSLLWVGILALILIHIYSLVAFAFFRPSFDPTGDAPLHVESLYETLVTMLRYGLTGILFEVFVVNEKEKYDTLSMDASFARFGWMTLFHLTFFILITTIGLNIIFGIIVDTFSELRDKKWVAESDMRDTCFICSRSSYDFEHHGKGFEHHITYDHNMWAYIFYFISLNDTSPNDYTAIDLYVSNMLKKERYEFFPLDRALCLKDEDSTDSKLDEVLACVTILMKKWNKEEQTKKREEERKKQREWVRRKSAFVMSGTDDSDGHPGPGGSGGHGGGGPPPPDDRPDGPGLGGDDHLPPPPPSLLLKGGMIPSHLAAHQKEVPTEPKIEDPVQFIPQRQSDDLDEIIPHPPSLLRKEPTTSQEFPSEKEVPNEGAIQIEIPPKSPTPPPAPKHYSPTAPESKDTVETKHPKQDRDDAYSDIDDHKKIHDDDQIMLEIPPDNGFVEDLDTDNIASSEYPSGGSFDSGSPEPPFDDDMAKFSPMRTPSPNHSSDNMMPREIRGSPVEMVYNVNPSPCSSRRSSLEYGDRKATTHF